MADTQTGSIQVNGESATELRYESRLESGKVREVNVRFLNKRRELAQATLDREQALEALGLRNVQAIENSASRESEGSREQVNGVLRGRSLERREIVLPRASNVVEYASSELKRNGGDREVAATDSGQAAVAGALATGIQVAALGGSDAQVAASAVKVAAPLAAVRSFLKRRGLEKGDGQSEQRDLAAKGDASDRVRETRRPPDTTSIPPAVVQRYLKIDDRYYFPDRTLAFRDAGTKLEAETENREVIRTLVDIARERNWEAIQVRGSETFRREVWREAASAGLTVKGYSPTQVEREALEREVQGRGVRNEVVRDEGTQHADADRSGGNGAEKPRAIDPRKDLVVGKLVEHGPARYRHDPKESASYYVTLDAEAGRQTYWGIGLQQALQKSSTRPAAGDEVGIRQTGSKAVTVTVPVRDAEGRDIGERNLDTHRNSWIVEESGYFKGAATRAGRVESDRNREESKSQERSEAARAFRNGQSAKEAVVREHPELAAAFATVRVAELFVKRLWDKPDDRDTFVKYVREDLARRIENGESIPSPKIKDTVNRSVNRTIDTVPKSPPEQRIARVKTLPDRDQGLARA